MSSDTSPTNSSVKIKEKNGPLPNLVIPTESSGTKENSPLDPIAEFQKLRLETAEINRKIMKSSPFLTPTADASDEMLGHLLNELKEMRKEIKEIKEDVNENQKKLQEEIGGIKLDQKDLKEKLKEMTKEMKENKKSLKEVGENQEQILRELKENTSLNQEENEEEPELYSRKDIRRRICGKWRNVQNENSYIWTKYEYDIFMVKSSYNDCFTRYKLGVEHKDGSTLSVENNTIVRRYLTNQGVEAWRTEYYIENERLHRVNHYLETEESRTTYERVGDPDTE